MISLVKQVLVIDLNSHSYEIKSFPDLHKYIGGVGIGLKLLEQYNNDDPTIFSVGPLNGFFPFASKTSIVLRANSNVEDLYLGGSLSLRIKFAGFDSIVIKGSSLEPVNLAISNDGVEFHPSTHDMNSSILPGRSSVLKREINRVSLDGYFQTAETFLHLKFQKQMIQSIVITGTKTFEVPSPEKYYALYKKILARSDDMTVEKGTNPSCSACPLGCAQSSVGEIGGNVLVHSLVGCAYAEKIFSDVGTVFSCLNVLGYDYTHEDLENLSEYVSEVLKELND